MSEPSDDELRAIYREAGDERHKFTHAIALRAVYNAGVATHPEQPTEQQIIERLGSLSSAAINRIIATGDEITKARFEDGVFE